MPREIAHNTQIFFGRYTNPCYTMHGSIADFNKKWKCNKTTIDEKSCRWTSNEIQTSQRKESQRKLNYVIRALKSCVHCV